MFQISIFRKIVPVKFARMFI